MSGRSHTSCKSGPPIASSGKTTSAHAALRAAAIACRIATICSDQSPASALIDATPSLVFIESSMYFSNHTSYLQRRCSSHAGGVCQRPSGASAYKPLIERCLFWYWGTPYFASAQYGLLFCHFAHLRRQRRHAGGGNVREYAPLPLG